MLGIQKMSISFDKGVWGGYYANPPKGWLDDGNGRYSVPPTIGGQGIFSGRDGNPFRQWNQVFAYYCSSDEWSGQVTDQPIDGIDPASGSLVSFAFAMAHIASNALERARYAPVHIPTDGVNSPYGKIIYSNRKERG